MAVKFISAENGSTFPISSTREILAEASVGTGMATAMAIPMVERRSAVVKNFILFGFVFEIEFEEFVSESLCPRRLFEAGENVGLAVCFRERADILNKFEYNIQSNNQVVEDVTVSTRVNLVLERSLYITTGIQRGITYC